ncbi:MAG: hypothetical protein OHK0046_49550 [Anaerolineae bacterium]
MPLASASTPCSKAARTPTSAFYPAIPNTAASLSRCLTRVGTAFWPSGGTHAYQRTLPAISPTSLQCGEAGRRL